MAGALAEPSDAARLQHRRKNRWRVASLLPSLARHLHDAVRSPPDCCSRE